MKLSVIWLGVAFAFYYSLIKHNPPPSDSIECLNEATLVKLRGMPWQTTQAQVADFFAGLNISRSVVPDDGLEMGEEGVDMSLFSSHTIFKTR